MRVIAWIDEACCVFSFLLDWLISCKSYTCWTSVFVLLAASSGKVRGDNCRWPFQAVPLRSYSCSSSRSRSSSLSKVSLSITRHGSSRVSSLCHTSSPLRALLQRIHHRVSYPLEDCQRRESLTERDYERQNVKETDCSFSAKEVKGISNRIYLIISPANELTSRKYSTNLSSEQIKLRSATKHITSSTQFICLVRNHEKKSEFESLVSVEISE